MDSSSGGIILWTILEKVYVFMLSFFVDLKRKLCHSLKHSHTNCYFHFKMCGSGEDKDTFCDGDLIKLLRVMVGVNFGQDVTNLIFNVNQY